MTQNNNDIVPLRKILPTFGEYGDFSGSVDSGESSESIASLAIFVNVAYSGESGALHKSDHIYNFLHLFFF